MYTAVCDWDCADSVLIREVSFIWSVLYREVPLYLYHTLHAQSIISMFAKAGSGLVGQPLVTHQPVAALSGVCQVITHGRRVWPRWDGTGCLYTIIILYASNTLHTVCMYDCGNVE